MGKLQLHELTLHNIKQHRDKKWSFRTENGVASLIGIAGCNGSGKSTILDSLLFLFTGDVPGENKADLISWADPKGKSFVHACFTFDGKALELYREAHATGAYMYYDGKTIKGITAVNAALESLTGLDRDLYQKSMFVRQNDITEVLFTEPAKRRKAWQRLMGMGSAEATYQAIGNYLSALPPIPDRKETLENGKLRLAALRGNINKLRKIDPGEQNAEDIKSLRSWLDSARSASNAVAEATSFEEEAKEKYAKAIESYHNELAAAEQLQAPIAKIEAELSALPKPPTNDEIVALNEKLNAVIKSNKAYAELESLADEMEARLNEQADALKADEAAKKNADELAALEKALPDIQMREQAAKTELAQMSDLAKALSTHKSGINATHCPLCEQKVENVDVLLKSLQTRCDAVRKTTNELEIKRKDTELKILKFKNEITYAANKCAEIANNIKVLEAKKAGIMARITDEYTSEALDSATKALNNAKKALNTYNELEAKLKQVQLNSVTANNRVTKAQITAEQTKRILEDAETRKNKALANQAQYTKESIENATQLLHELEFKASEHTRIKGERAGLRKAAHELVIELKTVKAEIKEDEKRAKAVAILNDVRDFFHHTQGPSLVVSKVLSDITSGVNEFLGYFNAPYVVVPDFSETSFRCVFTDGRPSPEEPPLVNVLSGGQKVALALSFRLAGYYMFSNRTGFITIDEPTNHLDDENIGNFRHLMDRLKTLSKEMGLQILISSHSRVIVDAMDYIIDLRAEEQTKLTNGE